MTPEAKALAPDPAHGGRAGIILLEETDRNETSGQKSRAIYHLRAKIFSEDRADLGWVRIAIQPDWGKVGKWWGWTVMPDGSVVEMKKSELQEDSTLQQGEEGKKVLTARLKVVPGCVIDYGYEIEDRSVPELRIVGLKRDVPVREFRYRWTPGGKFGDVRFPKEEGLDGSVVREGQSVLVTVRNLPAFVKELWMPPEPVARAPMILYYHAAGETEAKFWADVATQMNRAANSFLQDGPIRQAVESMNLPASSDLRSRLRLAYNWLISHLQISGMAPVRETPQHPLGAIWDGMRAQGTLTQGVAGCRDATFIYWGIARALGAQAEFVPTSNRTRQLFDSSLLSLSQISQYLIAVRGPAEPKEALTLVDICTGLPFGEVPWWHTGFESVLLGQDGADRMMLRTDPATQNLSQTAAQIQFGTDGLETGSWSVTRQRQQGLRARLFLRISGPDKGKHVIAQLCGEGAGYEILSAEESGADELNGIFRIDCKASAQWPAPDSGIGTLRVRFMGPWIPDVPQFPSPDRVSPVVFDYPWVDQVAMDVAAPTGFAPADPPPPVRLETPYGGYSLEVTVGPHGYHIDRVFSLTSTAAIPPSEYSALRTFLTAAARSDETPLEFKRSAPDISTPSGT